MEVLLSRNEKFLEEESYILFFVSFFSQDFIYFIYSIKAMYTPTIILF